MMIRNPTSGNSLTADESYENIIMNSKLYIGNISFKTTDAILRDTFARYGSVTDVYMATDRETGRPRGFAFVTFSNDTEAKLAVEKMNGVELDGRQLTVNEAKPKEEMGGRSFNSANRRPGGSQDRGNGRY